MIFVRFIPAPEPMTQLGMCVLGIFAGCIYGWCTTNIIWPSLMGLVLFGFTGFITPSQAWSTLISNQSVALTFCLMVSVGILNNTGLTPYLANWSITRKFSVGRPWILMSVVYFAAIVCSSIIHAIGTILIFWPLLWSICEQVGWQKGDQTPAWMGFSVVLLASTASVIMPFQIAVISNFGFLASGSNGAYDGSFNYTAYLIFTCTIQSVIFLVYMLFSKYIFRINLDKLKNYVPDYNKIINLDKRQKVGLLMFIVLFLLLMAPSFLPEGTVLFELADNLNSIGACMFVMALACWLPIENKPFVTFGDMISNNVKWDVVLMLGTAMTLSSCVNSADSGVVLWIKGVLGSFMDGLSPYAFVCAFMLLALILTNVINNVVVSAIFVPVSWTFCAELGLNPIALVVCFILFVDFAIVLPSASPSGAMMHSSNGWIPNKIIYKYGLVSLTLLYIICMGIGWPFALILF